MCIFHHRQQTSLVACLSADRQTGQLAVRLAVWLTGWLAGWLAGLLSRRRANDIVPCSTNMAPELRERSKAEAEAERLKRKEAHLDANVH